MAGRIKGITVEIGGDTSEEPDLFIFGTIEADASYDPLTGKGQLTLSISDGDLRSGAGTKKKVLTVIKAGDSVHSYGYYTEVSGKRWFLVTYGDATGFVSSVYLNKCGVVTTALHLRKGAGTDHPILAVLKKGTTVEITKEVKAPDESTWYQVKAGTRRGYVSAAYVKS